MFLHMKYHHLEPMSDRLVQLSVWFVGTECVPFYLVLRRRRDTCVYSEVVILLLLSSFKFSLAGGEIVWRSSGLQFPSVAETGSLALPLKVEAL